VLKTPGTQPITINGCVFIGNQNSGYNPGGALSIQQSMAVITNSFFEYNYALNLGGAIGGAHTDHFLASFYEKNTR
jgi:predicted outer membrane repeat protein